MGTNILDLTLSLRGYYVMNFEQDNNVIKTIDPNMYSRQHKTLGTKRLAHKSAYLKSLKYTI